MAPEKAHRLTQDPAAGFEIGWDYGIRGLSPPPDAPRCIVDGVEAARQHSGTAVPRGRCDRFERKWMLMRYNAWLRGRIVSGDLTPDLIRSIDVSACPVTRVRLTHGTGLSSDWSLDRVRNDGGYAACNIAVMSTGANIAKGALTAPEIARMLRRGSFPPELVGDGMDADAWRRVLYMMTYCDPSEASEENWLPMHMIPPMNIPVVNRVYAIQHLLTTLTLSRRRRTMQVGVMRRISKKKARIALMRFSDYLHAAHTARFRDLWVYKLRGEWEFGTLARWALEDAWGMADVQKEFGAMLASLRKDGRIEEVGAVAFRVAFDPEEVDIDRMIGNSTGGYIMAQPTGDGGA